MAAPTVQELVVKFKKKGFEDLDQITKGLKQIATFAGKTDNQILKLRKEINNFADSNRRSTDSIRGQVFALNKLKQSATIGSKAYNKLTADVTNLNTQLLTLNNIEKTAQAAAARSAGLPERVGYRKADDGRLAGTPKSIAQLLNLPRTLTEGKYTEQISHLNEKLSGLSVNSEDYSKILKVLIDKTRTYNQALAATTAKTRTSEVQRRIGQSGGIMASSGPYSIGTSAIGYNPYTATGRPSVEGLPIQGPFQMGPDRQAFMELPMIAKELSALFNLKNYRNARQEPLVPPFGMFPGGDVTTQTVKRKDSLFPETFVKSARGFRNQISSMEDVLEDLEIGTKDHITVTKALKRVRQEETDLIKRTQEAIEGKTRLQGPRGSRAARGLSQTADGTFIGLPGPTTATGFGSFKAPEVKKVAKSVQELTDELLENTKASKGSINSLTKQRNRLEELRGNLDPTSKTFARLTNEIRKTDAALMKLSGNKFSGENLRRTGQSILGAGFVGGPAGFLGAGLGAGIEALRPGGDMAGGAITGGLVASQVARPITEFVGGSTTYASDIAKAQTALEGITGTQENYNFAMAAAQKAIKEYNVPQEVAIRGITRMSAAVLGAGGNIHNASEAFLNVTAAIKGTAGGAEDVKAAITAMVQIYSKGKVSAEELSGQLGERFPAAVTKFADANNISTQALQEGLKKGAVGLDMLEKFVESLGVEYHELAKTIAESSDEAGARATIAWNKFRLDVGKVLKEVGAQYQETFEVLLEEAIPIMKSLFTGVADIGESLLPAVKLLASNFQLLADVVFVTGAAFAGLKLQALVVWFGTLIASLRAATVAQTQFNISAAVNPYVLITGAIAGVVVMLGRLQRRWKTTSAAMKESLFGMSEEEAGKEWLKNLEEIRKKKEAIGLASYFGQNAVNEMLQEIDFLERRNKVIKEYLADQEKIRKAKKEEFDPITGSGDEGSPIQKYRDELMKTGEMIQNFYVGTFKKMEDALTEFVMTGKFKFKEFARSVIADITRIAIRQTIIAPIVGTLFPKEAKGGVYSNGIRQFKKGGIVDAPTYFPFAKGVGLMGEAGPEAIMPLKRGKGGRLGVESSGSGGGVTTVNVSVDAKGTKVEGDGKEMAQLGRMLGSAIEMEIAKQKRPGGLLA